MQSKKNILQNTLFSKILVGIMLLTIVAATVGVLHANSCKIAQSPKQVLTSYIDAIIEENLEEFAASFYPKGSPEYKELLVERSDIFPIDVDGIGDEFFCEVVSFKMNGKLGNNLWGAEAVYNYLNIDGTHTYYETEVPFIKIDKHWFLHKEYQDYFPLDFPSIAHMLANPIPSQPKDAIPLRLTAKQKTEYSTDNGQYKTHIVKENEYVDHETFVGCNHLHKIILPSNTIDIEPDNFLQLTSLTAIKFDGESSLFTALDGVVYNKDMTTLVLFPRGKGVAQGSPQGEFHIPNTVTTIGEKAFTHYNGQIKKILFPSSVKVISDGAFCRAFNTSDYSVELNDGLEKIGASAFDSMLISRITIPQSVTEIGNEAFINAANLYQINFHQNSALKNIGYAAFENAENLLEITIPKGVTKIDNWLFKNCYSLHTVVLHSNIQSIGRNSFEKCYSLTELYIPKSVTSVGINAFQAAYNLTLYIEAPSQPSGWNTAWNMGYSQTPVWGAAFPKQ